jgi:hypothetical protein
MAGECLGKIGYAAMVDFRIPEAHRQVLRAATSRDH